jgi:hypothetical protein
MLDGKCKEDFEKWLDWHQTILESGENFNRLDFSLQSGVYLEFLDSVGIYIDIMSATPKDLYSEFGYIIKTKTDRFVKCNKGKTRQEALKEAITKANEIYNK